MSHVAARRVLVLILPEVHLLDLAGPVQAFWEANGFGGRYELAYVGRDPQVRSAQGLALAELAPLPEPREDDLVLVPGMDSRSFGRLAGQVPASWLRSAHACGARIASVCSGAFALAHAGLLDGRSCTTRLVTSAGVAAGIDMALSLVEDDHGPLVAARVARELVVYIRRGGDREQQSVFLEFRTHLHPGVHRVQDFLVAHPEERPSLAELSDRAGMSVRNLTRVFRRETGITLKDFAQRVKLQVARDLLRGAPLKVEAVASSCGFDDARQLRRLWRERYGTSVSEWRRAAAGA